MEKLLEIEEVFDIDKANFGIVQNDNVCIGIIQKINAIMGNTRYDGYKVTTSDNQYCILIDNGQCCCENWGYFASNDDFGDYIGKNIVSVDITDTALNKKKIEETYAEDDQVQFVDFKFSDGSVLQFAVYNAHNGFYGHSILILKGEEVMLQGCL